MECISLCAWYILFLYFVSQCIHWFVPTWATFLFRNLLWRLVSVLFLNINLLTITCKINFDMQWRPCNCSWCVIRARVHWQMAYNSHMLCPLSLPRKKITGVRSQLCPKQSSKGSSSENFLATDGFFECSSYCVTALSCLKKKERRIWTILISTVSGLPL